ncbi:hypothetical protein G3A43_08020 [Paraburkholderia aspalathi]|nr:hypothetical protein [Paraburkholderia aspalathi]MBK3780202.1 hypothetical protein [Paraburkholderia aspalathi]
MKLGLNSFRGNASVIDYVVPAFGVVFMLASAIVLCGTLAHLRTAVAGDDYWRGQTPTLQVLQVPLADQVYKNLAAGTVLREHVTVDALNDHLVVRGISVADLQSWKDEVNDLLVVSPDLRVTKVCAGSLQCEGGALVAELSGVKSTVTVK